MNKIFVCAQRKTLCTLSVCASPLSIYGKHHNICYIIMQCATRMLYANICRPNRDTDGIYRDTRFLLPLVHKTPYPLALAWTCVPCRFVAPSQPRLRWHLVLATRRHADLIRNTFPSQCNYIVSAYLRLWVPRCSPAPVTFARWMMKSNTWGKVEVCILVCMGVFFSSCSIISVI